jgi:hypothetical protein
MTLPIPSPPDYTDRDFSAIRARLHHLIQAAFPTWSDFTRSRFENVILDAFAYMFDVLSFYLDQMARETRFGTARLRKSMIELCRLIGYDLDTQTAATTTVIFSIPVATTGVVPIATGTTVKTLGTGSQVIKFQTTAPASIAAGMTTSAATAVEHSIRRSDSFTATGEAGEEHDLTSSPFLDASDSITVGGVPWTRVDHFLDSGSADTHYTVRVNEKDVATIKFGDGVNGVQAAPGAAIVVSYKTGGGEEGNVDAASIKKVEGGPWYDMLGNQVSLSCNNIPAASGGLSRESVSEARIRAPRSLRVLNRCVARTDFEDLAIQVNGVARALALSNNEDATVAEGQVKVWVVPSGGGTASAALLASIETYINTYYPVPVVCNWETYAATYVTVNVYVWIYPEQGADVADIVTDMRSALTAFFAEEDDNGDPNENIKFGYYYRNSSGNFDGQFPYSDVEGVIKEIDGIRRLGTTVDGRGMTLNGAEDDVTLTIREFPKAGTLIVRNGDTSATEYNGPI